MKSIKMAHNILAAKIYSLRLRHQHKVALPLSFRHGTNIVH